MSGAQATQFRVTILATALVVAVFVLDVSIPLGFAGGVPYVVPILVCSWSSQRHDIFYVATAGTLLTVVGYVISPHGGDTAVVLANRALGFIAIWSTALLTYRERKAKDALTRSNDRLNAQLAGIQDMHERSEAQAAEAVAMAEDLSEARLRAEEATARAEVEQRRVRSILETVTDAIVTIDAQGRIESFNPAAEKMFGYSADAIVGGNVSILMPNPHRDSHDFYLERFQSEPARIAGTTSEQIAIHQSGETFPIEITIDRMRFGDEVGYIGVLRDITQRKRAEQEIRRLAMTDPLTNLANRHSFEQRFSDALKLARRQGRKVALMLIDLDEFKPVNDTYGHPVGDAVLCEVADKIRAHCRESDTAARLGGDEFAMLYYDASDRDSVMVPAQRLIDSLSEPMPVDGHTVQISASIGVSMFPDDGETPEDLVQIADQALYRAKAEGRRRVCMAEPEESLV
jgi:diguanylate cyclase (GGDEF)-like protein/PAS domain S-box-containing protein